MEGVAAVLRTQPHCPPITAALLLKTKFIISGETSAFVLTVVTASKALVGMP